jgi:hypothetical protein
MLSFMSLAVSAWVKLRIVATGVVFISFVIPAGLGAMFNAIMGTAWGSLLNLSYMFSLILAKGFRQPTGVFGAYTQNEVSVPAAWGVMIFVCLLSLVVLNARLRARETVRG